MKKIIFAAALAMMFAIPSVNAQNCCNRCNNCETQQKQRPHKKSPAEKVENLDKRLNLTDEQAEKLEALFTDFEKEQEKMQKQHRDEMMKKREKLDKEIEMILTEEQIKVYKERRRPTPKR